MERGDSRSRKVGKHPCARKPSGFEEQNWNGERINILRQQIFARPSQRERGRGRQSFGRGRFQARSIPRQTGSWKPGSW